MMLGDPRDGVDIVFDRQALERFVGLAQRLLAVPDHDDPDAETPRFHAPASCGRPWQPGKDVLEARREAS
jgi:hypothetical protein